MNQIKANVICAKLISRKALPKSEVKELFRDENLRAQVEELLRSTGLELATHIYTDHVTVKVCKSMESAVFEDGNGSYLTTNLNLSRGAVTLLVILWAKLILPKRQMQIERKGLDDTGQIAFLHERRPIPQKELVKLKEEALLADFGAKLGGKTKFGQYLAELGRNGFIHRREGALTEGPLMDTLIDYGILASRIIDGCLAEVIGLGKDVRKDGSKGEEDVSI